MIRTLVSLNDRSASHAAADTQRRKTLLRILRFHLMQKCYQDTASGSSYRVSKRDRAAVGVQL